MKLFNNRAQIGSTLTWFIAVLIIFFIMAIHLGAVISLAGGRMFTLSENDLGVEKSKTDDISRQVLQAFLQKEVEFQEQKVRIADLLFFASQSKEAKNKVLDEIKMFGDKYSRNCFGFSARNVDMMRNPYYTSDVEYVNKMGNDYPSPPINITLYSLNKGMLVIAYIGGPGGAAC